MNTSLPSRPRPYWHVDAKWVVGLLLLGVLSLTLLVYNLVQVTDEEPAVDALSLALALVLSPEGIDDPQSVELILEQIRSSPDKAIQPVPGLSLSISEADLTGKSPREARLVVMRKVAVLLYRDGAAGLANQAKDEDMKAAIVSGGGVFNILTRKTHQTLVGVLLVMGLACLVLLAPLVFFSHRFGRLSSPGCVFWFAGLPGLLFFGMLGSTGQPGSIVTPAREAGVQAMLGFLAANILPAMAQIAVRIYLILVGLAVLLWIAAVVGELVSWWANRRKPA
jgi:hypothetical protein